jgi:L-fuconolactonase
MTVSGLRQWGEDITRLAAHPRLMCKVSGMVTEAGADWSADRIRPFLHHAAKAFGPERLVFGTDWPVCTLAATHQQVAALARDLLSELYGPDDMAKIFGGNAARLYRLPDNA